MRKFNLLIIIFLLTTNLYCQIVGGGSFIKGTSVEIGVNNTGGFEGTSATPPIGMHPRGGFGLFGFVANPQVNAWATFYGDYFTPGSPENGWGLLIGNSSGSPAFSNNCVSSLSQISSTPTIAYSHILNCYKIDWMGSVVSGTNNIRAHINYFLEQNNLYYTTTVSLTNNSSSTIPTLYYYRNVDPDNNQPVSGSFSTINLIEDQPGVGLCNLACVSAKQLGSFGMAYLAFAGIGPDFRVCYGGFSNRNAFNLWNGVGFTQTVGSTNTADQAISISYKIQNFLPGTTRTFKFVTILNASDKLVAVNNLLSLSFPGSAYVAPSACSPLNPPDTARICGPTKIEISGSNVSSYIWSWLPTIGLSSSTTFSAIVNPPSTTIYTITGIPTTPCTSTVPVTYTVVVIPAPPLPTITNSPITICSGLSSSIYLNTPSGGVGAVYNWTGPGGFTSSVQNPSIAISSPSSIGTYTVLTTLVSGCTSTGLTSVSFIPTSTIVVTPSITICQGGNLSLIANAPGATSYSWVGPNSFTSSVQNPNVSLSALPINSGVYTVTAYFVAGTATCTTVKTCTVTVIPAIPTSLGMISNICNNGTINLTSPSGGSSYSWVGPNSLTSSVQNPSITNAGLTNIGTYTVSITTGSCTNSGTLSVSVYPPLSFSVLPTNITLCSGKFGQLSSSSIGGSGLYNYLWSPILNLGSPTSNTTSVTGTSTTVYTLSVTDANCSMTLPISTTSTVNINPLPVITMTTSNNRGCEIFCTDLISSSSPPSVSCQWHFSDNRFFNSCDTTSYCFPTLGTYGSILTVTDVNGCVDSTKSSSFIIVDPNPDADFTWLPENPTVLINEVSFTDKSTIGSQISGWHWDFGDTSATNDTSNISKYSYIYGSPNSNTYFVTLKVTNIFGCVDSVTKVIKINDEFALFIPNVFSPNKNDGTNDVFKVSGIGFLTNDFEMGIYDRWGSSIFSTNDINKGWDGTVKGKLCESGSYVYRISIKDFKNKTRQFIGHITLL